MESDAEFPQAGRLVRMKLKDGREFNAAIFFKIQLHHRNLGKLHYRNLESESLDSIVYNSNDVESWEYYLEEKAKGE